MLASALGRPRRRGGAQEGARRSPPTTSKPRPEDLVLEDGRITVRGAPGRGLALGDVAAIATAPRPGYALPGAMDPGSRPRATFTFRSRPTRTAPTPPLSRSSRDRHRADSRYVAVDDCGTMINPLVVEGQIHGGIAHGIGNALLEEIVYDGAGQLVTGHA